MKTVCLIGKPNVGKSSLFNRLIKEKKAIILSEPGITRDRIYGIVNYQDKRFSLIDTGGIHGEDDKFDENILMQATLAIDEADIILFVVDGLTEISEADLKIRNMLKKSGKDVIVVVNKIDNQKREELIYNYYELGFEKVVGISAEHNKGIKELLDIITKASSNNMIIDSISTINKSEYKVYRMTVLVENKERLEKFMNDLLNLSFVQKVEREVK